MVSVARKSLLNKKALQGFSFLIAYADVLHSTSTYFYSIKCIYICYVVIYTYIFGRMVMFLICSQILIWDEVFTTQVIEIWKYGENFKSGQNLYKVSEVYSEVYYKRRLLLVKMKAIS